MAKRQGQASGASQSKTSQSSTLAVTSLADSDVSRGLQDAHEILREIRERVMDEAIEAFELYGVVEDRVLEGDELVEALRRYDGVSLIQERVIELQDLESSCKEDVDELVGLECLLKLNGLSLLRCLRNTAFAMGLDPTPFTVVQENLTRETRAKALGVAELMVLSHRGSTEVRAVARSQTPVNELEVLRTGKWYEQACGEYYAGVGSELRVKHLNYERDRGSLKGEQQKVKGHWYYTASDVISHPKFVMYKSAILKAIENDYGGVKRTLKSNSTGDSFNSRETD